MSSDSAPNPIWNKCPDCGELMDATDCVPFTKIECPHCGAAMRVRVDLGKFRIVREIGVGGMSNVFRALDPVLEREVALKVLNEENSRDPERVRAFEREARLTASVRHPNVVQLFNTGWDHDTYYLAMELVEGGSLEDKLGDGGVEPVRLLAHATQIVSGLRAAHRAGLLHRDIKPANILFDAQGNAKIVDFGLALMGEEDDESEMWATPWYVAPEKLQGQGETVRSDIYSLGVTLRHALTGRPPFSRDINVPAQLVEAKQHLPSLLDEIDVGEDDDAIVSAVDLIERMMAFDPEQRFADYDELADELAAVRASVDERTVQLTRRLERRRLQRRNRLITGIGLGLVLLAIIAWIVVARLLDPGESEDAAPDWGQIATGGVASDSQESFLGATSLLSNGDFAEAYVGFQQLADDETTPPATAAWSAWNAAVAAWFEGEDNAARRVLSSWLDSDLSKSAEVPDFFVPMVASVLRIGALSPGEVDGEVGAAICLLAGLDAWSVGRFELAKRWFRHFEEDEGLPSWAQGYLDHLVAYRAEAETWQALGELGEIDEVATAREHLGELEQARAAVKTAGRMPWALDLRRARARARVEALERRDQDRREEAVRMARARRQETWAGLLATLGEQLRAREPSSGTIAEEIATARAVLEDLDLDEADAARLEDFEEVVRLALESPALMVRSLEERPWEGDLRLRDERVLEGVTVGATEGGLLLARQGSGGEELTPSDLVEPALLELAEFALESTRDSRRYYRLREGMLWRRLLLDPVASPDVVEPLAGEYPPFRRRHAALAEVFGW